MSGKNCYEKEKVLPIKSATLQIYFKYLNKKTAYFKKLLFYLKLTFP